MNWESAFLLWVQNSIRSNILTPFFTAITFLANAGWFWIALFVILLCFRRTRQAGVVGLLTLAFCAAITNLTLKPLVQRARPWVTVPGLTVLVRLPRDASFPSGHTTVSFAAACSLFHTLPHYYGVPAVILAALIALSRLYVGVHFPTDVFAGILIGTLGSLLVYHLYLRWQRRHPLTAAKLGVTLQKDEKTR